MATSPNVRNGIMSSRVDHLPGRFGFARYVRRGFSRSWLWTWLRVLLCLFRIHWSESYMSYIPRFFPQRSIIKSL